MGSKTGLEMLSNLPKMTYIVIPRAPLGFSLFSLCSGKFIMTSITMSTPKNPKSVFAAWISLGCSPAIPPLVCLTSLPWCIPTARSSIYSQLYQPSSSVYFFLLYYPPAQLVGPTIYLLVQAKNHGVLLIKTPKCLLILCSSVGPHCWPSSSGQYYFLTSVSVSVCYRTQIFP